jgi:opacity protein-like surface antigen
MKKITFLIFAGLLSTSMYVSAQDTSKVLVSSSIADKPFVPSGKVGVTILSNAKTSIVDNEVSAVGFELERAYIGYTYKASKEFSSEVKLDVCLPSDLLDTSNKKYEDLTYGHRYMYIKNAYGTYVKGNTTVTFGIIPMSGLGYLESKWGNRYAYRSYMDINKLSQSADAGICIKQSIQDNLYVDFSITNGEGYTKLQADKDFVYTFSGTFSPIKEVTLRLMGDFSNLKYQPVTLAGFAEVKPNDKFSICGEYETETNYEGVNGHNLAGFSLYTNYSIDPKVKLFARVDNITSTQLDPTAAVWNDKNNGTTVIGGIDYNPTSNLRVALSYNTIMHENKNIESKNVVGVYTEIKF